MHPEVKIFVATVMVIVICSLVLTQHFASPETQWHVRLDVTLALTTSASIVALVPFDVYTDDADPLVPVFWLIAYWTTQLLTWLLLPIHQVYADAGDFTVMARLHTAVRENLQFYAVMTVASVVGIVLLMLTETVTLTSLAHTVIAFSNIFGIATGMFLMGYGLVDLPRTLYQMADTSLMLRQCQAKVSELAEALQCAHEDGAHAVMVVQTTAHTMPRRHPLRWAMDIIDREAAQMVPMRLAGEVRFEDMDDEFDYDFDDISGLAELRRRVKRATTVYLRTKYQYVLAVRAALHYEDICTNKSRRAEAAATGSVTAASAWRFRRTGAAPGSGSSGPCGAALQAAEYLAFCVLRAPVLRLLSVLMGVGSVAVIIAEATIWIRDTDLSLFSHIIDGIRESNQAAVQVVVMVPLLYMCCCTYFSLFKLGKFRVYSLTPYSSDAYSLLLCGALVCRYSAPMCYNFLTLIPVVHEDGRRTVFDQMIGAQATTGAFELFNQWFPVVLPLYCGLIALNAFNRLARACCSCCSSKYAFDEERTTLSMEACDKGADLLRQERANLAAGLPIGDGTTSGTTSSSAAPPPLDPPAATYKYRMQGDTSLGQSLNRPDEFRLDMERGSSSGGNSGGGTAAASTSWDSAKTRLSQAAPRMTSCNHVRAGGCDGATQALESRGGGSSGSRLPAATEQQSRRLLDSVFAGIGGAGTSGGASVPGP